MDAAATCGGVDGDVPERARYSFAVSWHFVFGPIGKARILLWVILLNVFRLLPMHTSYAEKERQQESLF